MVEVRGEGGIKGTGRKKKIDKLATTLLIASMVNPQAAAFKPHVCCRNDRHLKLSEGGVLTQDEAHTKNNLNFIKETFRRVLELRSGVGVGWGRRKRASIPAPSKVLRKALLRLQNQCLCSKKMQKLQQNHIWTLVRRRGAPLATTHLHRRHLQAECGGEYQGLSAKSFKCVVIIYINGEICCVYN